MIEINQFGINPLWTYKGRTVIEVLAQQKQELIKRFIETLEGCKCGIKSHEFKINRIIEEWKK